MKLFYGPSLLLALALVTCASSRLNIPDDVNLPSVRDDVAHKDLTPRDRTFDLAVAKGEAFMDQLLTDRYTAPITDGSVIDSQRQGWKIVPIPPPYGLTVPDGNLRGVLLRLFGRAYHHYYEWSANYDEHDQHAHYRNLYGPEDGFIAALDTFNGAVSTPEATWSELSWRIWENICESVMIDPKRLKYIIRHEVQNRDTLNIITQIYEQHFGYTKMGDRIIMFSAGRTQRPFTAMLGSPTGNGVAWMLLNKRSILRKTIERIIVHKVDDEWEILFELEPTGPTAVPPPSGLTG